MKPTEVIDGLYRHCAKHGPLGDCNPDTGSTMYEEGTRSSVSSGFPPLLENNCRNLPAVLVKLHAP